MKRKNHRKINRFYIIIFLIAFIFLIIEFRLFYLQIIKHDYYLEKLAEIKVSEIAGESGPRGKIYDRNGNIIVDNISIKQIVYTKPDDITSSDEVEIAYSLATYLDVDFTSLTNRELRIFWIINNKDEANNLITSEERVLLDERKITNNDIYEYKIARVKDEELEKYSDYDYEAAYIYTLMNDGYSYMKKIIKKGASDLEYANVGTNLSNLRGVSIDNTWERYYPYGDVFKTILGSVSENGLPYELKEYYLAKGYSLTDRVGVSYLEYQYEDYLKGEKAKYRINSDGTYTLISEAVQGNDIVLSIDINLQKEVEDIITEELLSAKNQAYTQYLDTAYVIIQDPNTGEILAMAGKKVELVDGEYKVYDNTVGILTNPVTVGSVIKGASHIVGYNTGALTIGEVRNDACIKIAATPLKCSFTSYGNINDLQALQYSSNTYQFRTAMKVGGANYVYGEPLVINDDSFDIYRNIFNQFGLGVKTEIDLPIESLGYIGKSKVSGLLLDFSIGQYDTYTPIQLSQYISTIANGGSRLQPHLLKAVYAPSFKPLTNLIYEKEINVLNKVDTDPIYMNRVKEGFRLVFTSGTGRGYMDSKYNAAGKTGTAQSFKDTDGDGLIDTATTTSTFASYAPYDNPTVTFTVVAPDIAPESVPYSKMSRITQQITDKVSKKYFEFY